MAVRLTLCALLLAACNRGAPPVQTKAVPPGPCTVTEYLGAQPLERVEVRWAGNTRVSRRWNGGPVERWERSPDGLALIAYTHHGSPRVDLSIRDPDVPVWPLFAPDIEAARARFTPDEQGRVAAVTLLGRIEYRWQGEPLTRVDVTCPDHGGQARFVEWKRDSAGAVVEIEIGMGSGVADTRLKWSKISVSTTRLIASRRGPGQHPATVQEVLHCTPWLAGPGEESFAPQSVHEWVDVSTTELSFDAAGHLVEEVESFPFVGWPRRTRRHRYNAGARVRTDLDEDGDGAVDRSWEFTYGCWGR